MNRTSIAAAAFSIAAIAAGAGVPVGVASSGAHPTTGDSAAAFAKQDTPQGVGFAKWIGPRHTIVEAGAAGAFMKITGPDV
jgi:hypothetical protein